MKLSKALDSFILSCRAAGLSKKTHGEYQRSLNHLVIFLGDPHITKIKADDLNRFIVSLQERKVRYPKHSRRQPVQGALSVHTIHAYVRYIKRFFNWLEFEGKISTAQNVAIRLRKPRLPKLPPKDISETDLRSLFNAARHSGKLAKRNVAILFVLVDTGCRVGGLVRLRVSDVDLENCIALFNEKGEKTRAVPFEDATRQALLAWLAERPGQTDFVFSGREGQMSIHSVYHMINRLAKKAGVKGRANPHRFRHTFAKDYLMHGGDFGTLADLMGHSDIKITKDSYSVFVTEELKRKHSQHSQLSRMLAEGD